MPDGTGGFLAQHDEPTRQDGPPAAGGVGADTPTLADGSGAGQRPSQSEDAPLLAGTMVDHYRVMRPLGKGGMGTVYLARDTQLGRTVALKMVRASVLRTGDAAERFLFEARATARFNHPHIITIYGVGEYQGQRYVALEYLRGHNLRERIEGERLGVREAARLGLAIAEALQEAHGHHILHRDLKPENVMIPVDGRLRVLDFGLAKLVEGGPEEPSSDAGEDPSAEHEPLPDVFETAAGGARGTPTYMAPEQWNEEEVTGATDVWALGLILVELMTGERPYAGLAPLQICMAVCSDEPVPLPAAGIPDRLARLLVRCLDKDPGGRPLIGEVVEVLATHVGGGRAAGDEEVPPFQGLLPFDERDARRFFGRDAVLAAFLERLRREPVLPVVGPSGAGKSSFVLAGVIPRLRDQGPWTVLRMRPGRRPLRTLAARLLWGESGVGTGSLAAFPGASVLFSTESSLSARASMAPEDVEDSERDLADELLESPARLALRLLEIAERSRGRVLLVVDQLEELFTHVDDEAERRAFLEALCSGADDPAEPVRVIMTVRSDFIGRVEAVERAREALGHVTVLGTPGRDALVEIMTRLPGLAGAEYADPRLVHEMVAAVADERAALPLLQVTGQVLWERRDRERKLLLRSAYEQMGGVAGALALHADGVLEGLAAGQLAVARDLLTRLVTPEGTRRVTPRAELLDGLDPEAPEVLDRLVQGRLVLVRKARRRGADEAALELVHESLIGSWARLAGWLDESQEETAFRAEVGQAAALWERRGGRDEELWQGEALHEAQRKAAALGSVPEPVRRFLAAGDQREHRLARRRRTVYTVVVAALAVLALVMGKLALDARSGRQAAEAERAGAQLAQARSAWIRGDPLEARATLRSALETQDSPGARALWWQLRPESLRWTVDVGTITRMAAFSPDGQRVALACDDGTIRVVQVQTGLSDPLRGHDDSVMVLDWSGATLISGGSDGQVGLWDMEQGTGHLVQAHSGRLWAAAIDPTEQVAATAGDDQVVLLWDLASGGEPRPLPGLERRANELVFSPDGRRLATAHVGGVVRLWDVEDGTEIASLRGHTESVYQLAFSPDGHELASASKDRTVRQWDGQTGAPVRVLRGHTSRVYRVQYSPDGGVLASSGWDMVIRLWDRQTGEALRVLHGHSQSIEGLAFTPDGGRLVSKGNDYTVRVWDVASGAELRVLRGHTEFIWSIAVSPDGAHAVSVSTDQTARLWSLDLTARLPASRGHEQALGGVVFAPDSATVFTVGDMTARNWDVATGAERLVMRGHDRRLTGVALSPDGLVLATSSDDRSVRTWQALTGHPLRVLGGDSFKKLNVAFAPDNRTIATGSTGGAVELWDVATMDRLATIRGHRSMVYALTFSPDGTVLASTSSDGTVRLTNVPDGSLDQRLPERAGQIYALTFVDQGRGLLTGGADGSIRRWDLRTGADQVLATSEARIYHVTQHPDGRRLGVARSDGTVSVLDMETGASVDLVGHDGAVYPLAFSPDGRLVATAGDDATVRLWDVDTGLPLWRGPLLRAEHGDAFTHLGWQPAVGATESNPADGGDRWRRAVEERARLASASGDLLCLQAYDDTLELWDTAQDRQLASRSSERLARIEAGADGCLVLDPLTREARRMDRDGEVQVLQGDASAVARDHDEILVATGREVVVHGEDGVSRRDVDVDITALLRTDRWLVVGHRDGAVQRLPLDPAVEVPSPRFQGLPSSAVTRLAVGPAETLIAGFASGRVGLWSLADGSQLFDRKLHGAVTHLVVQDQQLAVLTDLGDLETLDLSVFHDDRCAVLREIWDEVPITWIDDRPVLAGRPADHPCFE